MISGFMDIRLKRSKKYTLEESRENGNRKVGERMKIIHIATAAFVTQGGRLPAATSPSTLTSYHPQWPPHAASHVCKPP